MTRGFGPQDGPWRIRYLNSFDERSATMDPRPSGARGFTTFVYHQDETQKPEEESIPSSVLTTSPAYSPDAGLDGLGVVELDRLLDIAPCRDETCPHGMQLHDYKGSRRRCQNMLGFIIDTGALDTARMTAHILGPASRAGKWFRSVTSHTHADDC